MEIRFIRTVREIVHLAWPVLISQLAVMANAVIDTVMSGRLGATELAGVGIGASIVMTLYVTSTGVLLALTPMIAHLHGAGRPSAVGEEVRQSIWVALGLAVIAVLLMRFPQPFLALTELQPAVEEKVRAYLNASSWGVPGLMLFRVFSGFSTGVGQPRAVMRFNLLAVSCKIPLNLVFIPFLGGAGCAVATSILSWLNAALAWRWCSRRESYREFALFTHFSPPRWSAIRDFLKLGLPIGATFLVDVTAFSFMTLFISRFGPATSGAHQIAANLAALTFMLPLALGNAAAVLSGRALGAGNPLQARRVGIVCLLTAMAAGLSLSLLLWLGAPLIASAYTNDATVHRIAVPLIGLVAIYHIADALQAAAVNILRGFKHTTAPMLIYAGALWGIGLGGGYQLGVVRGMGAQGFWVAAIASIALAGVLVAGYFLKISRQLALRKSH
ncbi:MAG TPA: MATE family efflux transporter [Rhodocyclaceae bacterium]|nr:MATE family efflux transporter [Rhodocyclaceae bacterium]